MGRTRQRGAEFSGYRHWRTQGALGYAAAASACVLSLGLAAPITALAFDADVHPAFTRTAVEAYKLCQGTSLPAEAAEALIAGTQAEDVSVRTLGQRVTNWHFYNRNASLKSVWLVSRNLDDIFAVRIRQLNQQLAQAPMASVADVYERGGRVLHYIQDMSVPAHVVPVFHANLLVWRREDGFDAFKPEVSMAGWRLSPEQCEELRSDASHGTPLAVLSRSAKATLMAIGQRGQGDSPGDGSWNHYWIYPAVDASEAEKGWGEYGECAFVRGSRLAGCKPDAELEALYALQSVQTLKDSVWMLFYLDKQLSRRAAVAVALNSTVDE